MAAAAATNATPLLSTSSTSASYGSTSRPTSDRKPSLMLHEFVKRASPPDLLPIDLELQLLDSEGKEAELKRRLTHIQIGSGMGLCAGVALVVAGVAITVLSHGLALPGIILLATGGATSGVSTGVFFAMGRKSAPISPMEGEFKDLLSGQSRVEYLSRQLSESRGQLQSLSRNPTALVSELALLHALGFEGLERYNELWERKLRVDDQISKLGQEKYRLEADIKMWRGEIKKWREEIEEFRRNEADAQSRLAVDQEKLRAGGLSRDERRNLRSASHLLSEEILKFQNAIFDRSRWIQSNERKISDTEPKISGTEAVRTSRLAPLRAESEALTKRIEEMRVNTVELDRQVRTLLPALACFQAAKNMAGHYEREYKRLTSGAHKADGFIERVYHDKNNELRAKIDALFAYATLRSPTLPDSETFAFIKKLSVTTKPDDPVITFRDPRVAPITVRDISQLNLEGRDMSLLMSLAHRIISAAS